MKKEQLVIGKYITVIRISDFMAHTTQNTWKIGRNTENPDKPNSIEVNELLRTGRTSPKKRVLHVDMLINGADAKETLIIVSDKPLTMGSDSNFRKTGFHGNAKLNLGGGTREEVKALVASNINENFTAYDRVTFWGEKEGDEIYTPLYTPEEIAAMHATSTQVN